MIGRAILLSGRRDRDVAAEALTEFDTALFAAERLREDAGIAGADFGWLEPCWLGAAGPGSTGPVRGRGAGRHERWRAGRGRLRSTR